MIIDTTSWHWPQWYFVTVWAIAIPCAVWLHGKPKTGKWNAALVIINILSTAFILISGGFFK